MMKIREHTKEDIPLRVKWLNNPKVNKLIGDEPGKETDLQKQKDWFDNYEKDENKKFFTICDNELPIGIVGLSNISENNKNADLFIAIGEDEYRGKGFGKESMKWILNFAFEELKLNKVNLGVFEENESAVMLYKNIGFEIEGIMKEEVYFDGKFHNFLSMAIFKRNRNKN